MQKTCYHFAIDVVTIKDGAVCGHELLPYVVESRTYERARAMAADYGQTIARSRNSQSGRCYYRVIKAD